jgi:hypothetical protein
MARVRGLLGAIGKFQFLEQRRRAAPGLRRLWRGGGGRGCGVVGGKRERHREGDWFLIGLCAGKSGYALHICAAAKDGYFVEQHAARLGKVKTGRSCINFKKLEDLNLAAAMTLVKQAVKTGGINAVG